MERRPAIVNRAPALIAERYRVEALLAEGGVGRVYRVSDVSHGGAQLALKRLRGDASARLQALFETEYQTLASLRHPHTVEVHEYGRDAEGAFYTMELLEGGDLREQAPMPWREVCAVLRDAALALQVLHARGLVHRDVSPRNLWRGLDGTVKLIDFGALTRFGRAEQVIGTPPLLSPEAFYGRALDARVDLYSLGAVGYFLLTGRNAYPVNDVSELPLLWQQLPPPPSALVAALGRADLPELPRELDLLLMSLLSQNPIARPGGTAELIDRIDGLLGARGLRANTPDLRFANVAFVGRERELRRLRRRLLLAGKGRGQSVLIEGEAGSGRSRLLQQLALEARVADAVVLHVDAASHPDLHGVASALCLRLIDALPQAAVAAAAPHAPSLAHISPALRARLGVPATPPPEVAGELRVQIQTALCAWFVALAERHTLVLLVDGLERADDGSSALLLGLARAGKRARVLLCCSALGERGQPLGVAARALQLISHTLKIAALTEPASLELLRSVFGEHEHLSRLSSALHASARGLPGHVLELAAQLVRAESIRFAEGSWVLPTQLSEGLLSRNRRQALDSRLARVIGPARELGRLLAVQSGAIPPALCAALAGEQLPALEPRLDALCEHQIMTRDEDGLRFSHEQFRLALLGELDPAPKQRALSELGHYLLAQPGNGVLERLRAAVHLLESGDTSAVAIVTQAALHITMREPDRLAPALPVIEHALALFRAADRSQAECCALLGPLAIAGYFVDRKWAVRYGDEALTALQSVIGLDRVRNLRPRLGGRFALGLGLGQARLAFARSARGQSPSYTFKEGLVLLFMTVSALAASGALVYDHPSARRAADVLEPFAALGTRLAPAFAYEVCCGLAASIRDTFGESYARWSGVVARLERSEPILGLPSSMRARYKSGLMYAMAIMDSQRDDERALRAADQLDALGVALYPMSTDQLRFVYHAHNGNAKRYAYYRELAEQRAIQQGSIWQNETWTLVVETIVALRHHDAMAMKRVAEQLRNASKTMPTLAVHADRSRGAYLLMRERHLEALPWLERCLAEETRASFGWGRGHGVLARAYNELGRHADALAVCERVLREFTADDLAFPAITLPLETERLVAEAGLGAVEPARERLRLLFEQHRPNQGPLTLAELHDAAMRVALLARDEIDARAHCDEITRWYGATGIPSLIQRCALVRARLSAVFDVAPLTEGALALSMGTNAASAERSLASFGPLARAELAKQTVRTLAEHHHCRRAFLFWVKQGECSAAAALDDETLPPAVLAWLQRRVADRQGDFTTAVLTTGESAREVLRHGGDCYRLVLLSDLADGENVLLAAALVAAPGEPPPKCSTNLLRLIARQLSRALIPERSATMPA